MRDNAVAAVISVMAHTYMPGYLDRYWTKASWTDKGVRDKVGATHFPLPTC